MTKKTIALASLAITGMMVSWSANADVITWCGATNPFNTSECTFDPIEADSLTDITGPGNYTAFNYNNETTDETTFYLNLYLDYGTGAVWITVWEVTLPEAPSTPYQIEDIVPPTIVFGQAMLSGIQFTSNRLDQPKEYKNFDMTETQFTFACLDCAGGGDDDTGPPDDDDTTPVPEPGTLALLGIGLAGLGLSRRRGSRKS